MHKIGRTSSQIVLLGTTALLPAILSSTIACAADPKLERGARIVDSIGNADTVSQDGQVSTILFDSMNVGTSPGTKMPLVVTRTAIVNVPISGNDRPLEIFYDIRGYVATNKASHATLVVQACGETTVVDLAKAIQNAKSSSTPKAKQKREKPAAAEMADDYFVRIKRTLPGKSTQNVTFFLLVEKEQDNADDGAALWVDSLDVSIVATTSTDHPKTSCLDTNIGAYACCTYRDNWRPCSYSICCCR